MLGYLGRVITENAEESIFLPVVVLGYIYAKYDSLPICAYQPMSGYTEFLFLDLSRSTYLIGTFIAAVGGAILYRLLNDAELADGSLDDALRDLITGNSLPKMIILASTLVPFMIIFYLTPIVLLIRLCNPDFLVIGGTAAYVILLVTANADRLVT